MILSPINISLFLTTICVALSALALVFAVCAYVKVAAFEKSTHRIQFKPVDSLFPPPQTGVRGNLKEIFNPSNEDFDFDAPLTPDD